MINVLVATPQDTIDHLLAQTDRRRLESMANVAWRADLNAETTESEYAAAIAEVCPEIIMTGWTSPQLVPAALEKNPSIKCVIHITGQLKWYVHRGCLERGLTVTNWGDIPAPSVAESALMMMLMSLRRAYFCQILLHERKEWSQQLRNPPWRPEGLFDKTVGLYGYGLIARALVPMIMPFNPKILVYSSWIDESHKARYGIKTVSNLEELFARSDVVSVHTGNRADTFHTVNAPVLAAMRDGGHVINTARGAIIDTDALVRELKSGRLFAALDVFEQEPLPPDHPLRGLPNCILFPHQGGPSPDYAYKCGATAVDQVRRYIDGEPLKHRVTLQQYDRMT